jgi:hypothetical protein
MFGRKQHEGYFSFGAFHKVIIIYKLKFLRIIPMQVSEYHPENIYQCPLY